MKHSYLLTLIIALLFITGCGPTQTVTRTAADSGGDLSGRWNETDARLVADEMIADALTGGWLNRFTQSNSNPPVVIVGRVRNESMEHIDTEVFTKEMERAFVNSGHVSVVASADERINIRDERMDQQSQASIETASALAEEIGADFMLIGNISSIVDRTADRRQQSIFYTVNLELVNVENNQKVWIGNKQIRKEIERSSVRW